MKGSLESRCQDTPTELNTWPQWWFISEWTFYRSRGISPSVSRIENLAPNYLHMYELQSAFVSFEISQIWSKSNLSPWTYSTLRKVASPMSCFSESTLTILTFDWNPSWSLVSWIWGAPSLDGLSLSFLDPSIIMFWIPPNDFPNWFRATCLERAENPEAWEIISWLLSLGTFRRLFAETIGEIFDFITFGGSMLSAEVLSTWETHIWKLVSCTLEAVLSGVSACSPD